MSLDRGRLEQINQALHVISNTRVSVVHIINTYQYRTVEEIINIFQYCIDILSSIIEILGWQEGTLPNTYEIPAKILTLRLKEKLSVIKGRYLSANNQNRLQMLVPIKNDINAIQRVLRLGFQRMIFEWRRAQN
ncbi:MAG: hypothetical protein RLZZ574_2158 [Cyanobacteriota bacterium]